MKLLFVLREQSGPRESLNCPADCPVEGRYSLHSSWGPCLSMTYGSKTVEDFATALTQMAVFISFIFSFLKTSNRVVHPSPQTSMQIKRNPTSQHSPADSQQYKTTTTKHQSIHQLLKKIKTKKNPPTGRSFLFLFVLGRVKSSVKWVT